MGCPIKYVWKTLVWISACSTGATRQMLLLNSLKVASADWDKNVKYTSDFEHLYEKK